MNKTESPSVKLTRMIHELEEEQKAGQKNLRNNFHDLLESLTPGNLVRNIFHHVVESPELRRRAIVSIIGIAATAFVTRFATKKIKGNKAGNIESEPASGVSKIIPLVLKFLIAVLLKKKDQEKKRDSETYQASRV